jgi:hypothetical protein
VPQDVALVDADLGVVGSGIEDLGMEAVGLWGDPLMRPCLGDSFLVGK